MASWPTGTVPFKAYDGDWMEEDLDAIVEFQVAVGLPKRRKRTSDPGRRIRTKFIMTKAQRDAVLTFFRTDCARGALPFDVTHPVDGGTINLFWAQPPSIPLVEGKFIATFEFLKLPG